MGWGSWDGVYDVTSTRQLQASVSMRLRFDETRNGSGKPQHLKLRYTDPRGSLEWSDAPPVGATESPLLMSPVPRRSAQAALHRTPLGELEGYLALASHPISAAGPIRGSGSDLYAARLARSWLGEKVRTTLYAGYTHEKRGPATYPLSAGDSGVVHRSVTYGATDELGYRSVQDVVSMHDLHATLLHLMGLDHLRLTFQYAGRNFRLTDVHGHVVHEVLA